MPELGVMPPQARAIIEEVAAARGIDPLKVATRCREKAVFRARVEISKRLDARRYSTTRIASILNQDHTTIVFYLGRGKKKPSPERPSPAPEARALKVGPPPKPGRPRKQKFYLVPYAGADMKEYRWQERPANRH